MQIYVLSVGVDDYGGQIAIPNLHCAVNDACSVYRVLRTLYNADGRLLYSNGSSTSVGGGPRPLAPQGHGTRAEVLQAINEARRYLHPEDLFMFFFSGHGVPDSPGYILPHSAEYGQPGTYLMYRALFSTLATLPCMHVMCFLNCCYAGMAAAPAALPGMIMSKKHAALYAATNDETVTLDRLPGSPSGCSPFAQALVDYLERETAEGASFRPEALAAYIEQHAQVAISLEGHTVEVHPVFVSSLVTVGAGVFPFEIRRPGFGFEVCPEYHCATGELLRVPVRLEETKADEIEWTAHPRLAGLPTARMKVLNGEVELVFQYPGDFDIEIAAKNGRTGEKVCHTVTVHVRLGESPPPSLEDHPLALCRRGESYSGNLRIRGGMAPFQVTVEGLPEGLEYDKRCDSDTIRIHGIVPSMGGGGTPLSGDNGPIVRMIDIHVTDSAGRDCQGRKRLVVYNRQDYCHVEKGTYSIGCRKDAATIQAICEIIQNDMKRIAAAGRMNLNVLQAALNAATTGAADQLLDEIVSVAPHAQVELQPYLIKKYPVTARDWQRFLDETNKPHIPLSRWPPSTPEDWRKPVTCISYQALSEYLQWKGTRLPTGREWQVAADGGQGFLFPWGNEFDQEKCNVCGGPRSNDLSPVDTFDSQYASRTGTRDMVGNAAEWVDRRVYWSARNAFAQVFRGGSFRDTSISGIISRDSREVGVLFHADETAGQAGETRFDWLGFRDVIDLDPMLGRGQSLVVIPDGEVQIDDDTEKSVPGFRMARCAVSNLEYWEFVQATGHRRPAGWKLREDALPFPHDQRYLPVVNVSYLDAHAFCLWKSRTEGGIYCLPTPEQWLAAAQGGEHRRFPWEGDFNLQFCNEITSGWGKRVPVFDLPEGQSKHGVYNLVGNVHEWVGPLEVRGGSWLTDCRHLAQNWYRSGIANDGGAFDFRRGDVGFRYVLLESPCEGGL
ncbi:MAG: SUMF1/EgtB/PvdO family nonheme iron enzyme [Phycisphaerae bacterium]|nr:SUMF1/EgtB/PvdO family nonheme iron enzyme [Phycisphaerae bacterium]